MENDSPDKPKIIIDEDWKSQVQAEKEKLAREHEPGAAPAGPKGKSAPDQKATRAEPLPPANLTTLFSTLATQALVALGQFPHPAGGEPEVHLDEASHFIDMLQMLEEKTAAHRTADESRALDNLLYQLRMVFVEVGKRQPA